MPVVDQIDTSVLNGLSPREFIGVVGDFSQSLATHRYFKDHWVDFVTHPLTLNEQLVLYHDAVVVAETIGGHKSTVDRDDRRNEVCISVQLMAQYVVMRAYSEKDPTLLNDIVFKVKARPVKSGNKRPKTLIAPTSVAVKHGPDSGSVVVSYDQVPYAGSYEIQVCTGDPNVETSWQPGKQYSNRRVTLQGLEPASMIYIRVRCHGTGEPGPYSNNVNIIVL